MDLKALTTQDLERYNRHLALPEFSTSSQKRLKNSHILIVGAGGLGASSIPYLAGAGVGKISICDDDTVQVSNLHRQTIYKTSESGQSKAELAAQYAQNLNPEIEAVAITERFEDILSDHSNFDLLFDGSDNFETKTLLNSFSIDNQIPLITASVNQTKGQCGIFAGYASDKPCYHCLFPNLPTDARNCNEAGVFGTAAGITGLYQAHLSILFLSGLYDTQPGQFLSFDFEKHRVTHLDVPKNKDCNICKKAGKFWKNLFFTKDQNMTELIAYNDLKKKNYVIVDVRTTEEIANDPMPEDVIHIEVSQIPSRYEELPQDKLLAFVCAGNVRSVQAAEYLSALGYENITVLDKFSL